MYRQAIAMSVGLGLLVRAALPQQLSSALTPDQLVSAAIAKNRNFLALQQRIAEARGQLRQAGVRPAPEFQVRGASSQATGDHGEDDVSVGYAYTFETYGKRDKRIAVALRALQSTQAELDDSKRQLRFEVKIRYVDAVSEHLKLQTLDQILKGNQEYYRLTEARVKEGDAAPLEAKLLKTELSRDAAQRALAAGRARSALLELKTILDIPAGQDLHLADLLSAPAMPDQLPTLQSLALRSRPDLQALRLREEQSARETTLTVAESKPNLTVSGSYSHIDSSFPQYGLTPERALVPIQDHHDTLGVGLSIPITGTRRNRGNIESAAARQAAAKLQRKYLESVIPTEVEAAYERWRAAKDALAVFDQDVVRQSEENLAVMKQSYTLGELRLIDVVTEQRRVLDTELSYIDSEAELYRAYAGLEQATGGSL